MFTKPTQDWLDYVSNLNSENFSIDMYKDILDIFILSQYREIRKRDIDNIITSQISSFVEIKKDTGYIYSNLSKIEFNGLYTTILYNIVDNYEFNYIDFPISYRTIFSTYDYLISLSNSGCTIYTNCILIIKKWLNYTFGLFNREIIRCYYDICNDIKSIANNMVSNIYDNFDILYIDTDTIYYNSNLDIPNYIYENYPNLSFDISYIGNMIIFGKKKFIEYDDNMSITKIKGIRNGN